MNFRILVFSCNILLIIPSHQSTAAATCSHDGNLQNGFVSQYGWVPDGYYRTVPLSADGRYAVNSILYFSCHRGFSRDGPDFVTCSSSGAWKQWITNVPGIKTYPPNTPTVCRQIVCPVLPNPGRGKFSTSNGRNAGSVATLACDAGFYPSNTTSVPGFQHNSKSTTCLYRNYIGFWDPPGLRCVQTLCPARGKPGNGDRSFNEVKINGGYPVGTGLTYWCNLHYRVKGERQQECLEDGTWSHNPVSCKHQVFGGCFPAITKIKLENGTIVTIPELKKGNKVTIVSSSGRVKYSDVRTFLEKDHNLIMRYLSITTVCNKTLTLSPNHLVYARKGCSDEFNPIYADQVFAGDEVLAEKNVEIVPTKVIDVSSLYLQGAYVPLTAEGNIIVDEVLASCYPSSSDHDLAHLIMAPIRWFTDIIQTIFGKEEEISVFVRINEELGKWMLPRGQLWEYSIETSEY